MCCLYEWTTSYLEKLSFIFVQNSLVDDNTVVIAFVCKNTKFFGKIFIKICLSDNTIIKILLRILSI